MSVISLYPFILRSRLRSWVRRGEWSFESFEQMTPNMSPEERCAFFGDLPRHVQHGCWRQLAEEVAHER